MHLSKIFTGRDRKGNDAVDILITVEYDPKQRAVQYVICMHVKERATRTMIDISSIMLMDFPTECDMMVNNINWSEVYAEEIADKLKTAYQL